MTIRGKKAVRQSWIDGKIEEGQIERGNLRKTVTNGKTGQGVIVPRIE